MANSFAAFPLFKIRQKTTDDFLAKAEVLAKEENVSLLQYIAGMLKHSLRGDNLAHVHFFQDGSGDTYNTDDLDRMHEEALADDAAGLITVCNTKEESDEFFRKLEAEVDAGKEID
jgi:hypothetical protein